MNLACVECKKPLTAVHQTLKRCSCGLAGQNLELNGAFDSPKPVINPKPAPLFEKTEQIPSRFVFCKNYEICLNLAITRHWNSFTCEECNNYGFAKGSPVKWLADNLKCWELIDALEKMERGSE